MQQWRDLVLFLKHPITDQALPMYLSLVFPSRCLVRVTWTLEDKGEDPNMFKLWKTPAEFCHAPCCGAAGNFIIIYPPRLEVRGILRERERDRACLLGLRLHRSLHKNFSILMPQWDMWDDAYRVWHVQDWRKRERVFPAKNPPKIKNIKQNKQNKTKTSSQSFGICLSMYIFADSSRKYSNYVTALKMLC